MVEVILTFLLLAGFGAVTRAVLGIYKAYTEFYIVTIDWKRVIFEIAASMFFGSFGIYLLSEITKQAFGWQGFGLQVGALVAGFLGADIINIVTKKLGATKGLNIVVAEEQLKFVGLNQNQVNALVYLRDHNRITNEIYQKMNSVSHATATRDLTKLVSKGKLRKAGKGKNIYYTPL